VYTVSEAEKPTTPTRQKVVETKVTPSMDVAAKPGTRPLTHFMPDRAKFGDGKLGVAKRALEEAADEVACWGGDRSTVSELKTMKNPPADVKAVLGMCVMLLNGESEPVCWSRCIAAMSCAGGFVTRMSDFRLNKMMSLSDKTHRRLDAMTTKLHPREAVLKSSKSAAHVFAWVTAVLRFHHIYRKHLPVLEAFAKQGRRIQICMRPSKYKRELGANTKQRRQPIGI
jgi:hypothetical protein